MKENTWKHNINSGKAAPQSPARHLQFQLLAAVLGNKDEKLDDDPGNNIFAVSTAMSVPVWFSCLEETGWTLPNKEKHFHSCKERMLLNGGALEKCGLDTAPVPSSRPATLAGQCWPGALPNLNRNDLNEQPSRKRALRKAGKSLF